MYKQLHIDKILPCIDFPLLQVSETIYFCPWQVYVMKQL